MIDGRYRVQEELGGGGFAVVHAGVQVATGLPVAIKVLRSHRLAHVNADSELARFELEMRAIARIAHPAVVRGVAKWQRLCALPPSRIKPALVVRLPSGATSNEPTDHNLVVRALAALHRPH